MRAPFEGMQTPARLPHSPSETVPSVSPETPAGIFDANAYYLRGNAPRRWQDYLAYPRVLFTVVLCALTLVLHVVFGIYVWLLR